MTPILVPLLASATPVVAFESTAPVAYMVDTGSGATLYSRGERRRIPTASMAKMMTAWVAFEAIKAKRLKPDQKIKVSAETWKKWNNSGSTMYLKPGEDVSVEDLLHGILTLSGNDASVVLAEGMAGSEEAFVKRMNAEAAVLGMKDSHFGNANGWPDGGKTYSTANDLAYLAQRIIIDHPALFRQYFGQREFRWNNVTQPNRNPLLGSIDGADGMKTGHSEAAGYCLVGTVQKGGRRLLMVIAGLPTQNARLTEARRFMNWGFDAWAARPLFKKNRVVAIAPVQLGEASQIALVAPRDLAASLPKNVSGKITLRVRYKGPIRAPFRQGAELAQLVVKLPGGSQQVMPLVAARSVNEAGFFGRAWNGAKYMVGA